MTETDDFALFREAIKGTKKINQDTFIPSQTTRKKINELREMQDQ